MAGKRRVFVIDQAVRSQAGHGYNLLAALKAEVEARGWEWHFLCARDPLDPSLVTELRGRAVLDHAWLTRLMEPPAADIGAIAYRLLAVLRELRMPASDASDIVLFPYVGYRTAPAIAAWLGDLPETDHPTVGLLLWDHELFDLEFQVHHRNSQLVTPLLRRVAEAGARPIRLWAVRDRGLAHLRALGGPDLPVERFPWFLPVPPAADTAAGGMGVALLGLTARVEKGLDVMLDAIALIPPDAQPWSYVVQLDFTDMEERRAAQEARIAALREDPRVRFIEGSLPLARYHAELAAAKVVAMPYTAEYVGLASGVFDEAVSLQKIVIVPERSVMADELERLGIRMPLIERPGAAGLVEALGRLAADLPFYEAEARRLPAGQNPSKSAAHFLDELLAPA